jgi:3-hydroxyacyl-CoA dehydrogenase/enoyl-CoA hydratase/3-hydroxybutyryl-CoA epimerase
LFRGIESKLAPDAVLATNTSSIVLEEIAKSLMRPERFVGLHFFNPVARLPLVEVIKSSSTDQDTMQRAIAFVTQIGKLPLPCRSAPGFLVNRILTPYMLEALRAHQDGYALETIDAAAQQFGMPMGPIELADRVGLDVAAHVIGILSSDITHDVPDVLQAMVASGRVGLKSGAGFYRYESGRPVKAKGFAAPDAELTDRLILPLLNESVACLSERIVEDEDLLDAGVIFGTGFAPFRGGPLCYARQQGVSDIVGRLQVLAQLHGTRFTPHPGWMALTGPAAVKPSAPS